MATPDHSPPGESAGGGQSAAAADRSLYARYRAHPATDPVEALGFWTAVVLPFVHLPLLAGVVAVPGWLVAALLVLNAVAVVAGHGHRDD